MEGLSEGADEHFRKAGMGEVGIYVVEDKSE